MPNAKSTQALSYPSKMVIKKRFKSVQQLDKNNNNSCPTTARSKSGSISSLTDPSNKKEDYEKYSFRPRSIQKRIETEKRQKGELVKEPKPKHKPPPLSKYRRKTANARERSRMREINTAYEVLQKIVPQYPILPTNSQGKTCEKLTKITTLRLAMDYIQTMQKLLRQQPTSISDSDSPSSSFCGATPSAKYQTPRSYPNSTESDSIANSTFSSLPSSSCGCSNVPSTNNNTGPVTLSPVSSSKCSLIGPDCIQTVMRSVVTPAAAAAISANSSAAFNNQNSINSMPLSVPKSLGILSPRGSITTIVTIPSHPHAQYSRLHSLNILKGHPYSMSSPGHHVLQQFESQIHTNIQPPTPPQQSCSQNFNIPFQMQPQHIQQNKQPNIHTPSFNQSSVLCSMSPKSQQQPLLVNFINDVCAGMLGYEENQISVRDCAELTHGDNISINNDSPGTITTMIAATNNKQQRTGSLSSVTESDFNENTNDLLSEEESVLDEPMLEDIVGVLELNMLLGTDSSRFSEDSLI